MRRAVLVLVLSLVLSSTNSEPASSLDLEGTAWARAAERHDIDDARLLYAIALAESGRRTAPGLMQPWPWTLHVPGRGALFFDSHEQLLAELRGKRPDDRIDVGPMQVNTGFHMDKVASMDALSDFETNLDVGARVLRDCLDRHHDLMAGIGCYHSNTRWRAERYARTVLAFLEGLRSLGEPR